jgi:hypothetical protein
MNFPTIIPPSEPLQSGHARDFVAPAIAANEAFDNQVENAAMEMETRLTLLVHDPNAVTPEEVKRSRSRLVAVETTQSQIEHGVGHAAVGHAAIMEAIHALGVNVNNRIDGLEAQIVNLDANTNNRMNNLEANINNVGLQVVDLNQQVNNVGHQIAALDQQVANQGALLLHPVAELGKHTGHLGNHVAELGKHNACLGNHVAEMGKHTALLGNHVAELGKHNALLGNLAADFGNQVVAFGHQNNLMQQHVEDLNITVQADCNGGQDLAASFHRCTAAVIRNQGARERNRHNNWTLLVVEHPPGANVIGFVPLAHPASLEALLHMNDAQIDALRLEFNLPPGHFAGENLDTRRQALLRYLTLG